jgi:hypothetical protein
MGGSEDLLGMFLGSESDCRERSCDHLAHQNHRHFSAEQAMNGPEKAEPFEN